MTLAAKNLALSSVAAVVVTFGLLLAWRGGGFLAREAAPPVLPPAVAPAPVAPANVPVLVYHNVDAEKVSGVSVVDAQYHVTAAEFRAQMTYLKEAGFAPVPFAALAAYLAGAGELPPKPVVISFDDGRRNQLENAVPVLDELGLTATFFVFTNAPDRNLNYFTWDEIRALEAAGHEIGSHTRLHAYLTKADDETLAAELVGSQEDFEKKLGHRVAALAYPFGLSDDCVREAAVAAGYAAARGLRHFVEVGPGSELDLPGYIVTGDMGRFKKILEGSSK